MHPIVGHSLSPTRQYFETWAKNYFDIPLRLTTERAERARNPINFAGRRL
jgi:hypothetical protein